MNLFLSRITLFLLGRALFCASADVSGGGLRNLGVGLSTEAPIEEPIGSIAQLGMSDPDLSILVQLVTLAGLGAALDSPGPFTVFAPTNAAFMEVMADLGDLDSVDVSVVVTILSYHVVPGVFMASDISDGLILTTLMGETIVFDVDDDGVFVNQEVISTTDLVASNGVVHKIDGVMFPEALLGGNETEVDDFVESGLGNETYALETDAPTEAPTEVTEPLGTIPDVVASDSELTILAGLTMQAMLVDALSTGGPFTVFAPVNAAFFAAIAEQGLDPSAAATTDGAVLAGVLTYHVVPGTYIASDIVDGLTLDTLQGESVVFGIDGDVVTVNGEVVLVADIPASNGVIHKIGGVLVPGAAKMP